MAQTLTVGDRVTIIGEHNKGKSATIHKIQETQACCWIEDTMYLWYPLEELQVQDNDSHSLPISPGSQAQTPKESDKWYTPPKVKSPVIQVLGKIDLDPCADDGRHIPATTHYTASDDGLTKEWYGRVFMNPPYSCPGKWVTKLQAEVDAGRVVEAIALVPAAVDTNWLHPYLSHQPICFWKGRIKFLDTNYQEKDTARQSHCLLYWGDNPQKFKEVFDQFGTVKNVGQQSLVISRESIVQSPELTPQSPVSNTQYPIPNTMTFQFPQTQAIASELAQLQERINQLTATLQPYRECEQRADELLTQVSELATKMKERGLEGRSLTDWASKLYFTITGESVEQTDTAAVEVLKTENASLITKIESLEAELKESKSKGDKLTKRMELLDRDNRGFLERIGQLQSRLFPLDDEQKQFIPGDRVVTKDGDEGMVIGFVYENVMVELPNGRFNLRASNLTKLDDESTESVTDEIVEDESPSATDLEVDDIVQREDRKVDADTDIPSNPDAEIQQRAEEFMAHIKSHPSDLITYGDIEEVCQGDARGLKELALYARTKTQKKAFESIPSVIAKYINETGDRSPLDWVGDSFKEKVENILSAAPAPL